MVSKRFSMGRGASLLVALAAAAAIAGVGESRAAVIGVNFVGNGVSVTGTTGVVPQTGWNNAGGSSGTNQAVTTASGAAGGTLTYSTPNGTYGGGSTNTPTEELYSGWLDNFGPDDTTVTLSDLPSTITGPGGTGPYDVYLYIGDGNGFSSGNSPRGGQYTVNGVSVILGSNGGYSSFTPMTPLASDAVISSASSGLGNYYEFQGVTGATLNISAVVSNSGYRAPLNGFQVVSASPVPEPAALGLAGVGAIGLLLLGRRRKTA